jgi:hypothetical protein
VVCARGEKKSSEGAKEEGPDNLLVSFIGRELIQIVVMPWAGAVPRVGASAGAGAAAALIEEHGAVVIDNLISPTRAAELAALVLAAPTDLHGGSAVSMLLNHDPSFEELVCHPLVVAVAHAIVGTRTQNTPNAFAWPAEDQIRLQSCDGLINRPGSAGQGWHLDPPASQIARPDGDGPPGARPRPIPDFPMGVNCMWMLTGSWVKYYQAVALLSSLSTTHS